MINLGFVIWGVSKEQIVLAVEDFHADKFVVISSIPKHVDRKEISQIKWEILIPVLLTSTKLFTLKVNISKLILPINKTESNSLHRKPQSRESSSKQGLKGTWVEYNIQSIGV
jgi:hypothetical protein